MRYDRARARKLVEWSRPHRAFTAKKPDPLEPGVGRLVEELGQQLDAAMRLLEAIPRDAVEVALDDIRRIDEARRREARYRATRQMAQIGQRPSPSAGGATHDSDSVGSATSALGDRQPGSLQRSPGGQRGPFP